MIIIWGIKSTAMNFCEIKYGFRRKTKKKKKEAKNYTASHSCQKNMLQVELKKNTYRYMTWVPHRREGRREKGGSREGGRRGRERGERRERGLYRPLVLIWRFQESAAVAVETCTPVFEWNSEELPSRSGAWGDCSRPPCRLAPVGLSGSESGGHTAGTARRW